MALLPILGAVSSVIGAGAAWRQANRRNPTVEDNIHDQARAAREAGKEYGFNPLTLLQYGQTGAGAAGAAVGGGAPVLGSISLVADAIRDVDDWASGDRDRRIAQQELDLDMRRIALEQARSGVVVGPRTATSWDNDPSPLGRRAVTEVTPNTAQVTTAPPRMSVDGMRPLPERSAVDLRREIDHEEIKSHSGIMTIDNPNLPFKVHVPTLDGDEALQWYELPSAAIWGGASWLNDQINQSRDRRFKARPPEKPEPPAGKGDIPDGFSRISKYRKPVAEAQGYQVIEIGGKTYARHPDYLKRRK